MKKVIKPELASGFRDYLPEEMIPRQRMMDTIRAVFERFGFGPLDTPSIEREEILTAGDAEFNKQIFRIASNKKDKKDEVSDLALRFDLTVPLARVVAANSSLGRPFKRYQIGKVFRAESSQTGRYKEFMQCDADIVGSSSLLADAEIIALVYAVLTSLNIENFVIKIGNIGTLSSILTEVGIENEKQKNITRVIDKLDKIGWKGVGAEMGSLGIDSRTIDRIRETLSDPTKNNNESYRKLIGEKIENLGVPENRYKIDFSIARGLDYYDGMVFETILTDLPEIGSICSGGRYDYLVSRFSKEVVPSVGASVGLDRLFTALEKLGKIKKQKVAADVLVLNFDESCGGAVQKTAASLRSAGIKTELYLGKESTFKGQLAYAVSREYPVVVIIGPKELERGVVQVKGMAARTQTDVRPDLVVGEVKKIIG
ncbi:MAG: histidine--tRNA ligase [Candidatus Doudnabacteria bacterium RIFCSPHIGHO2_01_FULL_49_9]|uniref:Histidine--tRNA ligase n=1 Tax=Candidatus Doudnabacteria bacterium RIFCSPHIGHO2_01_FULL_49_9 TaxID=1817827 RepID=A0A1F5P324_9BACT|nr:MAG: histidine--tRNA ligase [Candidatus Doudnabacteria bacterium RIFCSPHIGHO2_01_FULL_49_9]